MFVQEFLSVRDAKDFEEVQKDRDKEKKDPHLLPEFFTLNGQVKILAHNPAGRCFLTAWGALKFCTTFKLYFSSYSELYKK